MRLRAGEVLERGGRGERSDRDEGWRWSGGGGRVEAVRRGKERVGSDQQFIGGTAGETVDGSFSAKF